MSTKEIIGTYSAKGGFDNEHDVWYNLITIEMTKTHNAGSK